MSKIVIAYISLLPAHWLAAFFALIFLSPLLAWDKRGAGTALLTCALGRILSICVYKWFFMYLGVPFSYVHMGILFLIAIADSISRFTYYHDSLELSSSIGDIVGLIVGAIIVF